MDKFIEHQYLITEQFDDPSSNDEPLDLVWKKSIQTIHAYRNKIIWNIQINTLYLYDFKYEESKDFFLLFKTFENKNKLK